jgi:hypothetical protein
MPQFDSASYGDMVATLRAAYALIRDDTETAAGDKTKRITVGDILQHTFGYYGDSSAALSVSGSAALTDASYAMQRVSTTGSAGVTLAFPEAGNENHPFAIFNASGSAGGNITVNDTDATVIPPGVCRMFWPGVSAYEVDGQDIQTNPLWAAKGDLLVGTANNTASIFSVGTNGQKLVPASSETHGVKWIDDTFSWNIIIGNGAATVTTGVKGWLEVPYACTLTSIRLFADAAGAIVIDIWKDTYANFPPTDADSITSATPPTIPATNQKAEDTSLTNWTKTFAKGDILGFNVDSATTIKQATLSLNGYKTAVA